MLVLRYCLITVTKNCATTLARALLTRQAVPTSDVARGRSVQLASPVLAGLKPRRVECGTHRSTRRSRTRRKHAPGFKAVASDFMVRHATTGPLTLEHDYSARAFTKAGWLRTTR